MCGIHMYVHFSCLIVGGDIRVLDAVVASPSFSTQPDGKVVDGKGQTPLHLVMQSQWKREHSLKVLRALIETHQIPLDPSLRDNSGKKATDFLVKKDKRAPLLAMAADRLPVKATTKKSKKKSRSSDKGQNESEESAVKDGLDSSGSTVSVDGEAEHGKEKKVDEKDKEKEVKKQGYDEMSIPERLNFHLKKLHEKEGEYFWTVTVHSEANGTVESEVVLKGDQDTAGALQAVLHQAMNDEVNSAGTSTTAETAVVRKSVSPEPVEEVEEATNITSVMSKYGLTDFDGLPWEVEVTNNVLKFFKNEKEHPYQLRLRAARSIYELAEGKRGKELSKEVSNHALSLFEAKVTKGSRIIWQKAIQFSPRRTGQLSNPIYAQVIRVWEVVPDHDQLYRTIKQIEVSNERGAQAAVSVSLVPQRYHMEKKEKKDLVRGQEVLEIPQIFTQAEVKCTSPGLQQFTPAASPKDDEFNVTTFYSFSGAVLKSMLTGHNARRDFPFKEWPKEHEIINLTGTESILLLGRSGTGKTTCCLYRMWNEFKTYWDPDTGASVAMLPRKSLVAMKVCEKESDESEMVVSEMETASDGNEEQNVAEVQRKRTSSATQLAGHTSQVEPEQRTVEVETEDEEWEDADEEKPSEEVSDEGSSEGSQLEDSTEANEVDEEIFEHLHQVFVTKNYVLCAQMKKRFYDMAASHDFLRTHMEYEMKEIPHSFSEIDDHAYPLFLTARQFYILLDNSIGHGECFFRPREKDGSLRIKIVSSDYDHEDPDTLLDLENSDSEDEDVPNATENPGHPSAAKQHAQKYVEVTSLYFTDFIWPQISHKCTAGSLDPLLVWIEIQSFIKGSRAALQKGSALTLEDYLQIGNKMAPNFANQREKIYSLFKCYEEYCQNHRHNVFLFDECDLIHDIYGRLRSVQDLSWSIHSLYIDEVQDFTQAELALYLHCCRHPNSLFFTGDTAQSIMRGIAFRFQDLRSAFHSIHQRVAQVKVPQKPHTLTINFRSHSGILQLAGSIIDLLKEFFPGSIDHLPEDNGMFCGPIPVILESCDENDLALLLSSNRRESSRIEFGAHQVVLVQSKEAKENLPPILKGAIVLTIFESKGLEFDDVLLYNFFQDSKVNNKH